MNINYLNTLNTELVITKEDIILALTEGEVYGWKKSMRKLHLMDILINAIEEAKGIVKVKTETEEYIASNKEEDTMNTEEKRTEAEVNTINPNEAHVEAEEHVRSIEDIEADMRFHYTMGNAYVVDLAHDFYEVYISKAYKGYYGTIDEDGNKCPCKSFKSYINDFKGGKLFGVSYTMAMHYVNVHKYVIPHRPMVFKYFTIRVLIALVPYMKDEEKRGEVLNFVDNDVINEYMTLEEVKKVLEGNEDIDGTEAEETEAEEEDSVYTSGANTCEVSDEALDKAVEAMETYLDNNAHDSEVTRAWYIILKALDR